MYMIINNQTITIYRNTNKNIYAIGHQSRTNFSTVLPYSITYLACLLFFSRDLPTVAFKNQRSVKLLM